MHLSPLPDKEDTKILNRLAQSVRSVLLMLGDGPVREPAPRAHAATGVSVHAGAVAGIMAPSAS